MSFSLRPSILVIGTQVDEIHAMLDSCFNVETVASPSDIAEIARTRQFALVLVQLDIPEMLDYVKNLRRASKNRTTPLIGLLERDQRDKYDEVACSKAGITDYLTLPVMPDSVKLVIKRWIV